MAVGFLLMKRTVYEKGKERGVKWSEREMNPWDLDLGAPVALEAKGKSALPC